MRCRNWVQVSCKDEGEAFLFEYDFEGLVEGEWDNLIVYTEVSKILFPKWANWLRKRNWCNFHLSPSHWRDVEKIASNETRVLVEEKLQHGTFRNGMTIQLRAPISIPPDIGILARHNR